MDKIFINGRQGIKVTFTDTTFLGGSFIPSISYVIPDSMKDYLYNLEIDGLTEYEEDIEKLVKTLDFSI